MVPMRNCVVASLLCIATALPAATPSDRATGRAIVVARVGGEPIEETDVARMIRKVTRAQPVNPAILPQLRAQVLDEMIARRLVLAYAHRTKTTPDPAEIDAALADLKSKLAAQRRTLEEHLRSQEASELDLRRQLTWNLVWPRYLARYLTEARVESYFNSHRHEFDGTEISVSHLLLRSAESAGGKELAKLVQQAQAIRDEIVSGKITFADAARKYSAGPSAQKGGHLGFISRHGSMDESFCRAAFALGVGQTSQPVPTRFGVHLIRCDEIRPGSRQLADVRPALEDALARELLKRLAAVERRYTQVELTDGTSRAAPSSQEPITP